MKRVGNDQIQSAVLQYLKRRHYIDANSESVNRKNLKLTDTMREMASQSSRQKELGAINVVACNSCDQDPDLFEQQFTRFRLFVDSAIDEYKADLVGLLVPTFVHLYLQMICDGHKLNAHSLYTKHKACLHLRESGRARELVESLSGVYNSMDLLTDPVLTAFRDCKYVVEVGDEALQYLLRFLQSRDTTAILGIINLHIDIKVRHSPASSLQEDGDEYPTQPSSSSSTSNSSSSSLKAATGAAKKEEKEKEGEDEARRAAHLAEINSTIDKVQRGPPSLPSIILYSVLNAYQGLSCVSISDDSQLLAGGFEDSAVRVWSLSPKKLRAQPHEVDVSRVNLAGDCLQDFLTEDSLGAECKVMRAHSDTVYGSGFLPDVPLMISASGDATVRAWNLSTFSNVAVYRGHKYPIWDVDVSPMGVYFCTASKDQTARLWSPERTFPMRVLCGHLMDVDCVKFHPNGKYVATGSSDKTVRLWDMTQGKPVRLLTGHKSTILSVACSPNGKYLASAGEDRRVRVWDLATGGLMKELRGHTDTVYALAFNPDSSLLASGGADCTVRLWDIRQGVKHPLPDSGGHSNEQMASISTRQTIVHRLTFSKCNLLLAGGGVAMAT
ncbi:TAF5-like RNA polymerase II p300/CBP-associated factor-associated factor 65 kDa subunit 5L [Diadema antillarum]|uniref:TAF5-like RNA polymerase II p300/CBP-associated factor-associated factor 65 kDa subunit 5L n=1 Tax=Diadema antillarum TaxID=105358 RepID=UPI003A878536